MTVFTSVPGLVVQYRLAYVILVAIPRTEPSLMTEYAAVARKAIARITRMMARTPRSIESGLVQLLMASVFGVTGLMSLLLGRGC